MTRLIALALSTAALIVIPTTAANARDHHRNWSEQRDGKWDRHRDHNRYRSYAYRSYGYPYYGYAYPRARTVISVGYPGYYGGYGGYGCTDPATGAAVGAIAGGTLGGVIAGTDGHRNNTGAGIAIGGALGAVLGGVAASGSC
jgi:hypothetical protein